MIEIVVERDNYVVKSFNAEFNKVYNVSWNPRQKVFTIPYHNLELAFWDKNFEIVCSPAITSLLLKKFIESYREEELDLSGYKKPFSHQVTGIKALLKNHIYGLFDEMGLGKSYMGLVAADILLSKAEISKIIVICPCIAFLTWKQEIKELTPNLTFGFATTKNYPTKVDIIVVNYDILPQLEDKLYSSVRKYNTLVILDEFQRIKNFKAKRTKALYGFLGQAKYKWFLSGTPIAKRPESIYSFMKYAYGMSNYWEFIKEYCTLGNFWSQWAITGYKKLDQLEKLVKEKSLRRLKTEVLDLPEKIYSVVSYPMTDYQQRMYDEMKEELRTMVLKCSNYEELTAANGLVCLNRLLQIAAHPGIIDESDEIPGKILALDELLDDIMYDDRKVIIWTNYHATSDIIKKRYNEKYKVEILDGRVTKREERQQIVDNFQNKENPKILCINTNLGKESINLTRATVAIYFDRNFSYENWKQSQDRLHRIGQNFNCHIIILESEHSVDQYVRFCLEKEDQLAQTVLGKVELVKKVISPMELLNYL